MQVQVKRSEFGTFRKAMIVLDSTEELATLKLALDRAIQHEEKSAQEWTSLGLDQTRLSRILNRLERFKQALAQLEHEYKWNEEIRSE